MIFKARMAENIVDAEYCANMNPVGGEISLFLVEDEYS